MSTPMMCAHLLLEQLHRRPLPRVPEAAAWMEASDQVDAFDQSGHGEGILIHLYALHAILALPVIRPGDTVLDLACGPANQLAVFAQMHPDCRFIGLDASESMLTRARRSLAEAGVGNVELRQGDISRLDDLPAASVDCVTCTLSLHHLPDTAALARTLSEVRRVLRADGGAFFVDFGRLRRTATQRFFAYDRRARQSARFTRDFLDSMRAAFSVEELEAAFALLERPVRLATTALAPFMVVGRTPARRTLDTGARAQAREAYRRLTPAQRQDFDNMARWYRAGGLPLPCRLV